MNREGFTRGKGTKISFGSHKEVHPPVRRHALENNGHSINGTEFLEVTILSFVQSATEGQKCRHLGGAAE